MPSPTAPPLERDVYLTIPNALTVLRFAAIIPFSIWATEGHDRAALILFFIAGLTDTIDGTIARRFNQASKIGRFIDPLADKLFTCIAYVVLAAFRGELRSIPLWVMIAVVARDLLILAGSLLVYRTSRNTGFKPSIWGKLNTLWEISVVVGFLAAPDVPLFADILPASYILLLILLLISAGDYLVTGMRMISPVS